MVYYVFFFFHFSPRPRTSFPPEIFAIGVVVSAEEMIFVGFFPRGSRENLGNGREHSYRITVLNDRTPTRCRPTFMNRRFSKIFCRFFFIFFPSVIVAERPDGKTPREIVQRFDTARVHCKKSYLAVRKTRIGVDFLFFFFSIRLFGNAVKLVQNAGNRDFSDSNIHNNSIIFNSNSIIAKRFIELRSGLGFRSRIGN